MADTTIPPYKNSRPVGPTLQPEEARDHTDMEKMAGEVPPAQIDGQERLERQLSTGNHDDSSRCNQVITGGPLSVEAPQSPEHKAVVLLVMAVCVVVFLMSLDRTILATAVPQITNDFHSMNDVGWYASGFMFASSCLLLPFGKIYTFYSPKWVYLISIGIFEVGSLICGVAASSSVFIFGRSIAGAGSAGISVGAYTLTVCVVPLHKRPLYNGVLGAVMGVAALAGPLLGGAFTTLVSWRWCFLINLPIGGVAMLIVFFCLRPIEAIQQGLTLRQQLAQLDLLGEVFLIPSMVCLLLALQWGGAQFSWSDGRVIAVLVVFSATLVAFGSAQIWYPDTATIPPRIVKSRSIIAAIVFAICISATMMVFLWCIPLWLQTVNGMTAMRSGVNTIPVLISFCLGSVIAGFVVSRIGYYTPMAIASSGVTAIGAGLILRWNQTTSARDLNGYQMVLGLGLGMGLQQSSMVAQTVLMRRDVPTALGLINVVQQLSGAVFVSIGQNIFKASLMHKLGRASDTDARSIIETGAAEFRALASPQELPRILNVYNLALRQTFLLGFVTAVVSASGSCLLGWKSVKRDPASAEERDSRRELSDDVAPNRASRESRID